MMVGMYFTYHIEEHEDARSDYHHGDSVDDELNVHFAYSLVIIQQY